MKRVELGIVQAIPLESQISYSLLFTTFNLYSGSGRFRVNKPSI